MGDRKMPRLPMTAEEFLEWAETQEEKWELVDGYPIPKHRDETTSDWQALYGSLKGKGTDPDRVRTIEEISGGAMTDDETLTHEEAAALLGGYATLAHRVMLDELPRLPDGRFRRGDVLALRDRLRALEAFAASTEELSQIAEGEDAEKEQTFGEALDEMGWQPVPLPRLTLRSGAPGRRLKLPRPPEEAVLIAEGEAAKREILRLAGGYLEEELAAEWLGVSVDHLRRSVEEGTWIAVEMDGRLVVPACMMRDSMTVLILREILAVMPIKSAWMRLEWLVRPDEALGGLSPMEAIRDCREKEVRELARSHGAD